jgi:hypothetical protein
MSTPSTNCIDQSTIDTPVAETPLASNLRRVRRVNHEYIDRFDVAGQYVRQQLGEREQEAFGAHVLECAECGDRVMLARLFEESEKYVPPRRRKSDSGSVGQELPLPARWIAQFTALQLAGWVSLAVVLLLAIPAGVFWWELQKVVRP